MRTVVEPGNACPEQDLLLAAAGVTGSARQAVDRALSAGPDWTRVVQLMLRHRMASAVMAALEDADTSLVPTDLLEALRLHCGGLREKSTALVRELFALLDEFHRRSVVAVPFKGPLLGELLFGDAALRSPGDLDILVRADDVAGVCEALEERGYVDADRPSGSPPLTPTQQQVYRRFQCEYQFIRESDGIVVEPHWGLSQRPLAIDIDYSGMVDRARPTAIGERSVLTLAPDDLLLALCIHGAKHHWERLSWIRDVAALLAKYPDLDLEGSVARARVRGCARLLLLGLAVAHDCAGATLPPVVSRLIADDPTTVALQREVAAGLFGPGRQTPWNDRIDRFRFRMRERWSDRTRYVGRTLLSPRRPHIEMVALPGPLRWGYFPLKWGVDFVVLPVWGLVRPWTRDG